MASRKTTIGTLIFGAVALALSACAPGNLEDSPPPIGDFRLGYTVISEEGAQMSPLSREAGEGLLEEQLDTAIRDRLGRYRGNKWYHLSVAVGPYSLSGGGVPVVASPRSALIIEVTVWDDEAKAKLNDEPHAITVIEPTSVETFIGSGFFRTPEKQAEVLALSAADAIERWLKSAESPIPGVGTGS